jgi:hypothetical protein
MAQAIEKPTAPSLPDDIVEAMRRHLEEEHRADFDLQRDASFPGNDRSGVPLTYRESTPMHEHGFWCAHPQCRGRVFMVGEPPYGDPERNAMILRTSPALQHLTGGMDAPEREAVVEAMDRGELGQALANAAASVRRGRVEATSRSLGDDRRFERCASYLLWQVEVLGSRERAIESLVHLHETDLAYYHEVVGSERLYAEATFQRYWKKIPPRWRENARARHALQPESAANAAIAAHRSSGLPR